MPGPLALSSGLLPESPARTCRSSHTPAWWREPLHPLWLSFLLRVYYRSFLRSRAATCWEGAHCEDISKVSHRKQSSLAFLLIYRKVLIFFATSSFPLPSLQLRYLPWIPGVHAQPPQTSIQHLSLDIHPHSHACFIQVFSTDILLVNQSTHLGVILISFLSCATASLIENFCYCYFKNTFGIQLLHTTSIATNQVWVPLYLP